MKLSSPISNGHAVRGDSLATSSRRVQGGIAALSRVDVAFLNLFSAVTGLSPGESLCRVYQTRCGELLRRCQQTA